MNAAEPVVPDDAVEAFSQVLHKERTSANTLHIDCWACQATQSPAIRALIAALGQAENTAAHADAVFELAVPDEGTRERFWRAYWRDRLNSMQEARR